ncbi:bifunctional 4-hydroxy-2-oxoglutarate aldolase/2-dehydro-3-deoxy-phosphogluconate aldolase [Zhongshania guokunii]|uniref:2-dehydro-3-deoxy-phosphogluconate aldolase n=1 Tax=Zhongshania guokunii TaxID=641783 RepID=A0ABV3U2A9_9GAMM
MNDALTIVNKTAPVMPVAQFKSLDHAKACAELFAEAGVPAVEVTLRHTDAWQMVKLCRDLMPNARIGVGTVLNRRQMLRAVDEADFVISPGFSRELSMLAHKTLTTYIPGVATATEIMAAMAEEHRVFKLYPAEAIGGVTLLKSLAGPFPDAVFCPTGGISQANYHDYLALPNVHCVGGSWIVPSEEALAKDRKGYLAMLKSLYQRSL